MTTPSQRLSSAQTHWINRVIKTTGEDPVKSILSLAGDGSSRSFFRVTSQSRTFVLVLDPKWIQTQDYSIHGKFLADRGVPVPTFFGQSAELGLLLMEDLGDELLQDALIKRPQARQSQLLRLTATLSQMHANTYPVPQEIPASQRSFDKKKLMEEFRFSETHLVQGLLSFPKWEPSIVLLLEDLCDRIARILPLCFTHRDFHTRNVMVTHDRLVLIDFQDARLGPPHYDLSSLIYDPYVPLQIEERNMVNSIYTTSIKAHPIANEIAWDRFALDLELCAFQRMVKAAGSFASFFTRFQKRTHLPYLIPAIQNALQFSSTKLVAEALGLRGWLTRIAEAKLDS